MTISKPTVFLSSAVLRVERIREVDARRKGERSGEGKGKNDREQTDIASARE